MRLENLVGSLTPPVPLAERGGGEGVHRAAITHQENPQTVVLIMI